MDKLEIKADLRLRPIRIGFLVNPFDQATLSRVMRYSSCLWGGTHNPIIPISARAPRAWRGPHRKRPKGLALTRGYIEFFEPDVFVDATSSSFATSEYGDDLIERHLPRVLHIDNFIETDPFSFKGLRFGVEVNEIYHHLYDQQYQYVRRNPPKFALFEGDGSLTPFFEAAYGLFPADRELAHIRQAYCDIFEPIVFEPSSSAFQQMNVGSFVTPLVITGYETSYKKNASRDVRIFIFDAAQTSDLIDFWNLRILDPTIIPLPIQSFPQSASILSNIIDHEYRPALNGDEGTTVIPTVEFADSVSDEVRRQITERHIPDYAMGRYSQKNWYDDMWHTYHDGVVHRPSKVQLSAAMKSINLSVGEDGESVWLDTLCPVFAKQFGSDVRWINVLTFNAWWVTSDDVALCLPLKRRMSEFQDVKAAREALVSREGIILFQKYKDWRDLLSLSRGRDAVIGWLRSYGVSAVSSDAGRTAEELIRSVGGLSRLGILADAETVQKLNAMASRRRVQKRDDGDNLINDYPDRTASVKDWHAFVQRRANRGSLWQLTLNELTDRNILRLGLMVRCSHCSKENWYSLDLLNYSLRCERCLRNFTFPQGDIQYKNTPWHYRVLGSFSIPDYANGGYAIALTLRLFSHGIGSGKKVTYSTGLELSFDNRKIEVDYVLWYQMNMMFSDESSEPATVFGEAKSFGTSAFTSLDVQKMKTLGTKFPGSFLVFSCLKQDLSIIERRLLAKLAVWGRQPLSSGLPRSPIIILTGRELFFDFNLEGYWNKSNPRAAELASPAYLRIENLWTLADITQRVYLGLEPYGEWMRGRYGVRRRRVAR